MKYKQVTKEEFKEFLVNYPNEMNFNVEVSSYPLKCKYYDPTLGPPSHNVVAFFYRGPLSIMAMKEPNFELIDFDYHILIQEGEVKYIQDELEELYSEAAKKRGW